MPGLSGWVCTIVAPGRCLRNRCKSFPISAILRSKAKPVFWSTLASGRHDNAGPVGRGVADICEA
jgi:hypothetical protein